MKRALAAEDETIALEDEDEEEEEEEEDGGLDILGDAGVRQGF